MEVLGSTTWTAIAESGLKKTVLLPTLTVCPFVHASVTHPTSLPPDSPVHDQGLPPLHACMPNTCFSNPD